MELAQCRDGEIHRKTHTFVIIRISDRTFNSSEFLMDMGVTKLHFGSKTILSKFYKNSVVLRVVTTRELLKRPMFLLMKSF